LAGTRQESLCLGPGFHYKIDPKNIVNVNLYLPVTDVNAPSGGYQLNLHYIHPLNLELVRASFTSVEQLQEHIDAFIAAYNETAVPFAWTKKKVYRRRFKNRRITQL
jgi:hypothetical protein